MLEYIEQKEFQELPQRLKGADLHRAITNQDVDEIKRLIRRGVPMEVQNSRGMTPLQVVCTKKDPEMVAALLRYMMSFNYKRTRKLILLYELLKHINRNQIYISISFQSRM